MFELNRKRKMLENYLTRFARLNTDRGRHRWSMLTCHRAPHKPFLLLSVMDLIAQGRIGGNFVEPSFELVDTFNRYWAEIMPVESKGLMSYPFYHMRTEPFWELVPRENQEDKPGMSMSSMVKLRSTYYGATIDEALFNFLTNHETRERFRAILIKTYFAEKVRPKLLSLGAVNLAAYKYSEKLLSGLKQEVLFDEELEKVRKVRDQAFRRAIVSLYDHRCALCGIRMLTPEGHTVVEAAHIIPWSKSKNDLPTNGLSLCKLCHWSFDEGLMSVGKNYEVLISKRVQTDQNLLGHILTLSGRNIFTPAEPRFQPAQENLNWHRQKKFLK